MPYTLTATELATLSELNQLINGQLDPANAQYWQGQASDFVNRYYLAYDYLAQVQTQPGTPASPMPGVDASAWLWFRGAARINEGVGPFSTFIREYTKEQYRTRTGETASDALVQEASNNIARAVIADVLGNNGLVPALSQLGQADAGGTVGGLYGDASDFSPWSGVPLFTVLGTAQFFNEHILDEKNGTYDLLAMIESLRAASAATVQENNVSELLGGMMTALQAITANTSGFSATTGLFVQGFNDAQAYFSSHYATYTSAIDRLFVSKILLGRLNEDDDLEATNDADIIHAAGGNDTVRAGSIDSDIFDGGDGTDILDYTELGTSTETTFQVSQNGTLTGITQKSTQGKDLWTNFEDIRFGDLRDIVRMPDPADLPPDILEQLKNLKIDGGGGNDIIERLSTGGRVDGGDGKDTIDYSKLTKKLTIDLEGVTAASYETDGLSISFPAEVASNGGETPPVPVDILKHVETLVLGNLADKVIVDKESLKLNLKIDMAESNRQASPFNLDVYDLSNVGEGLTYRSGKVALGWTGPLSSFVGLAENLEVKNADKIILTPFDDTVVSASFGNVIHTGAGADKIWLGSNGVAIDDLSEDDRLTIAGVLPLFGGIRNGNKDTPYAYSYGGAVRWAEDVSGALQVTLFGGATTYILNWAADSAGKTFDHRPGHISLFTATYLGVFRLADGSLPSNASQMGWWDLFGALVKTQFGLSVWKGVDGPKQVRTAAPACQLRSGVECQLLILGDIAHSRYARDFASAGGPPATARTGWL